MLCRLPDHANTILPLAILVSALITLLGLAQANEILAFKSAGLSFVRIVVLGCLPAAAVVAVTHFRHQRPAGALGPQHAGDARDRTACGDPGERARRGCAIRPHLVRVEAVHREGRFLTDIALMRATGRATSSSASSRAARATSAAAGG